MDLVNKIQHNRSKIIQDFGVQLNLDFAKVDARCLQAPKIQYANRMVNVMNGVWRGEGMQFLRPETANKWAILNTNQRTRRNELDELAKMVWTRVYLLARMKTNSMFFLLNVTNSFFM